MPCMHEKGSLKPRDSPFVVHNHWGGGFVSPEDRIALNTLHLVGGGTAGMIRRNSTAYDHMNDIDHHKHESWKFTLLGVKP